jgi:hypothetical protein
MAEPIKNRTTGELSRAFKVIKQKLIPRGLKSRLMRLDNEESKLINDYVYEKHISFQLVPTYFHRRNAA